MKASTKHLIALAAMAAAPVHAAEVTLNTADTLGNSSFNTSRGWSNAASPAAGNSYVVGITRLRTPATGGDYTFAGDSLKITTSTGNLSYKTVGSRTITVNNLILDGGFIDHLQGSTEIFTLAGALTVTGSGSIVRATQGPIAIASTIAGTGSFATEGTYTLAIGGTNSFTGNLTVSSGTPAGADAQKKGTYLNAASQWKFAVGAKGVNNSIGGSGRLTLGGAFNVDLTAAGSAVGDSWTLVNTGTLAETYETTFNLAGFTANSATAGARIWTLAKGGVFYQFNEATGVLSVTDPDSDSDGLSDAWETANFANLDGVGTDDPDADGANNEAEESAATNPNSATSWPDVDADGLKDAWEVASFGNIAVQSGSGDPDGDHNTNLAEFTAGTSANSAASWPDSDYDRMNDGWETAFFGNLSKDGSADSDGDSFSDVEEHDARTHPASVTLSPMWSQLKHRWSFNGGLEDSVGGSTATIIDVGANGVSSDATTVTITGGDKASSDYIRLGSNLLPKSTTPVTIELWAKQNTVQNWSRIFDFNNGNGEYLMMAWTQGVNTASDRVEFRDTVSAPTGNGFASAFVDNKVQPYGTEAEWHIVLTLEPLAGAGGNTKVTVHAAPSGAPSLGAARGTGESPVNLINLVDAFNDLGRSPWPDSTANATYNEVRIWNGGLNAWMREALHTQGPDNAAIPDADADGLPDAWESRYFANTTSAVSATADNDNDRFSNRDEFLGGSNPNSALSTPEDGDADGLSDPWEIQYFGSVTAQDGSGDPDQDGFTNEQEENNFTPPDSADNDYDGLSDLWEVLQFTDASLYTGIDDPDGDGYSNDAEETAGSNPKSITSTPVDLDGDGLADAWETIHFASNTAQDGSGDPDLDTFSNEQEESARSNPNDATSYPGDINADGIADGHVLRTGDLIGTSSFNSGLNWDDATAPAAGSNYLVMVDGLRTPLDADPYTFAGDKLVLATGGRLIVKGNGALTVPALRLDGGTVLNALNSNLVFTLEGALHVSRASFLSCNNNGINLNAPVSGSGNLTLQGIASRVVSFNADNSWTGNLNLEVAGMALGSSGTLSFKPTSSGVTNAISGTGAATLNGAFRIDLGAASTTPGDSWDLITTTGAVTYGPGFSVTGFTADAAAVGARTWTSGSYRFDESSGVLTVLARPSGFAGWIGGFGLGADDQAPSADPDRDGINNLMEYALDGKNPAVADAAMGTLDGLTVSFAKRALAVSEGDITYAIESSSDLGGSNPWTQVVPTVNNATTIAYTLPSGLAKDFVRLKVTR